MKVFVAEDSTEVRERELQIIAGFPQLELVGTAADVPGCILGVEKTKPNLLLLDLRMPGGSGLDVLRKLQRMPGAPAVIVVTILSHEHYRILCMTLGARFFVDKSGDIEDLKRAIRNATRDYIARSTDKTQTPQS